MALKFIIHPVKHRFRRRLRWRVEIVRLDEWGDEPEHVAWGGLYKEYFEARNWGMEVTS